MTIIASTEWKSYFNSENTSNSEQLHDLFSNYYKKRQIPDLISSFVTFLNDDSASADVKQLPTDVLDKFALYCQDLQPTQSVKLWKLLVTNIAQILPNSNGQHVLPIYIDLLTRLMMNTKFFDHNISHFEELIEQFPQLCVAELLNFCLENGGNNLSILSSTLVLCHVFGEISMFLEQYFDVNSKREVDLDSHGWNLNHVHSYFNEWKEIYSIVKDDNECRYYYALLILQNIRSLDFGKNENHRELIENSAKLLYKLGKKFIRETDRNRSIWLLILNNLPLLIKYWNNDIIMKFCRLILDENEKITNAENLFEKMVFFDSKRLHTPFVTIIWEKISVLVPPNQPLIEKLSTFFQDNSDFQSNRSLFFQLKNELKYHLENDDKFELNDENQLEKIFKVFALVPLTNLTEFNQKRCIIGYIALISKLHMRNEQKTFCFEAILQILSKLHEIFSFLPIGVILKWLLRTDFGEISHLKLELIEILLLRSSSSFPHWNKLDIFFEHLKTVGKTKNWTKMSDLEKNTHLIVFTSLLKRLKTNLRQEKTNSQAKELYTTNQTEFSQIVLKCAKNTDFETCRRNCEPLLRSLGLIGSQTEMLERNPEMKSEFEKRLKTILPPVINALMTSQDLDVISCFKFFVCAAKFGNDFPDLLDIVWGKLKTVYFGLSDQDEAVDEISKTITSCLVLCGGNDAEKIVSDLLKLTILNYASGNDADLIVCLKLWVLVPFGIKNEEKAKIFGLAAEQLLTIFPQLVRNYGGNSYDEMLVLVMKLTGFILRPEKLLRLNFFVFPFHIFTTVLDRKLELDDPQRFADVFNGLYSILNAFLVNHGGLIAQKIPLIVKCISSLTQLLLRKSDETNVKSMVNDLPILENCAMNLNRLFYQFANKKLDFQRVVHYLLADYVSELESITLNPSIKEILRNGIFAVLDLCDRFAVTELQMNLSAPSRELFNYLHEDYLKHHKFKVKNILTR